jgi:uncharacterized protein (DUF427 family)
MSLTLGSGPFGGTPAGRFDFAAPEHIVYVEAFPRFVRAVKDGATVVSSNEVKLVHESKKHVRYSFPASDVADVLRAEPDPFVPDHVVVPWRAVDAWYEEDEEVYVHVRDPYHRIDVYPTSREVTVSLEGTVIAQTKRARGLYETGLPVRWYIPREDVRMDLLTPTDTSTVCPYKGEARYWSVRVGDHEEVDAVWSYERDRNLQREAEDVESYLCFYDTKVDVLVSDPS